MPVLGNTTPKINPEALTVATTLSLFDFGILLVPSATLLVTKTLLVERSY